MTRATLATAALLLATLVVPRDSCAQTIAIVGGKVHPVSGPPIENGTVLIRDGHIVGVGSGIAIPPDAQRIDATGKVVTPGLMNGATLVGLDEISSVSGTREVTARGRDRIAASFRPWEGLNPRSVLIGPARDAGITSMVVMPSGGLLSGQAAVIRLVNGSMSDMLLKPSVGMVANLGPVDGTPRAETLGKLREILEDARAYRTRRGPPARARWKRAARREHRQGE
jgi:hypothetical protein